jgi:TupA-like ATPgrasp
MNMSLREAGKRLFWDLAPYIPDAMRLKILFRKEHGYWPDFEVPRTFSEKVQWRKLHDRRSILTLFADKYRARQHIEERIGARYLSRIYWVSPDARALPFAALPERFVLKTNHGTRWNLFVKEKATADPAALIATLEGWLRDRYPPEHCEWGYRGVEPLAFAEEFLLTREGAIPVDYKFFVFAGKVRMIQVDLDRFTAHSRCLFDPDWHLLAGVMGYPRGTGAARPPGLEEMIECAERCSCGIDFVRADFYNVDGRIVFGELTNYPGGGFEAFTPPSFDADVGAWWRLDTREIEPSEASVPREGAETSVLGQP